MCPDPDSAHPERDMRMIEAFKQISARACEMAPRVGLQKNEVLLCDNFRVTLAKALRHRVGSIMSCWVRWQMMHGVTSWEQDYERDELAIHRCLWRVWIWTKGIYCLSSVPGN